MFVELIANQCCSPDGRLFISHHVAPPACFPIEIPEDDPFYSKFGQRCMNFMRTTTETDNGCTPPHGQHSREQVSINIDFIHRLISDFF